MKPSSREQMLAAILLRVHPISRGDRGLAWSGVEQARCRSGENIHGSQDFRNLDWAFSDANPDIGQSLDFAGRSA